MTNTDSLISISSHALSADINPFGAELSALRNAQGDDLLWNGDPAFWIGRAPLLFPIVGALKDDHYHYDGKTFDLPKHGFARRSEFGLIESSQSQALFRLSASPQTRSAYPFEFELDVAFALNEAALTMRAEIRNLSGLPMPASFGFHPAFRWPLPGAPRDQHVIAFDTDEPAPMRRLDKHGLVEADAIRSPIQNRVLQLDDALFEHDALIFDQIKSRALTYGSDTGLRLRIEFPEMPYLGIWTKPGANYVCIEPWQGIADSQGFSGDFKTKPGIVFVPPRGAHICEMRVTLSGEGS